MAVLFFLLSAHLIVGFELRPHEFENGSQPIGLRQVEVSRLTAFQFGDLAFHLTCLSGEDGVGNASPYSCEFGEVGVTCKAVILLIRSLRGKFEHLLNASEVAHKIIKVPNVMALHDLARKQVAHERPYLCGCVGDRSTRCEDYIPASALLLHRLYFEVQTLTLFRIRWIYALDTALHGCGKSEVLVFVRLVHKDSVNSEVIKVEGIIGGAVKHFFRASLGVLLCDCGSLAVFLWL